MRWLILGCGFVGSALARRLLARGEEVWTLNRDPSKLHGLAAQGAHCLGGDVREGSWAREVPAGMDVWVNCVSAAGSGPHGYRAAYVESNQCLVRLVREGRGPGRILYTSSTGVYPQTDGSWVGEDDLGGKASATGRVLRESEVILLDGMARGTAAFVLRLAGIYGPGRHYLLDRVRAGGGVFPGRGDYFVNLIHVEDIATGIEAAASAGEEGGFVFNLSDGSPVLKEDLVRWLCEQSGMPFAGFDPGLAPSRRNRASGGDGVPNRRIRNDRAREWLNWSPAFPSYREGFGPLLAG